MRFQFEIISDFYGTVIVPDPIGWEDISLSLIRDQFHGVVEGFPDKFGYYGTGYEILKNIYDQYGIEAGNSQDMSLRVSFACNDTDPFEVLYTGFFIFSKYVLKEQECIVEIPTEPSDCAAKFTNRLEEKVQLSTDTMSLPTKTIIKNIEMDQVNGDVDTGTATYQANFYDGSSQFIYMKSAVNIAGDTIIIQDDPLELNTIAELQDIGNYANVGVNNPNFPSNNTPIVDALFIAPQDGLYTFYWDFNAQAFARAVVQGGGGRSVCSAEPAGTFGVYKTIMALEITSLPQVLFGTSNTDLSCHTTTAFFQQNLHWTNSAGSTYALVAGDRVNLFMGVIHGSRYQGNIGHNIIVTLQQHVNIVQGSYFKVVANNNAAYPPVNIKKATIDNALSEIIDTITDGCMTLNSDYFGRTDGVGTHASDGCGALECISGGLLIRQNPNANLFCSMKQLYEGLNAIHNIGMNIEGTEVVIEDVKQLYLDMISISLDYVPGIEIKFDESLVFNNLIIGYEKWEAEEFNGLDEFNTKREYSNGISIARGNKTVRSSLIASAYAAEVTKRNAYVGSATKDYKYDNDLFIFCLKRSGLSLIVDQGNITGATNIIDPTTIYNYAISPARNAIRWFKSVITGIKNFTAAQLYFKYGEGNYIASGHYTGACSVEVTNPLDEHEDISYSDIVLGHRNPLFTGNLIEVDEMILTKAQYDTIKANSRKKIAVSQTDSNHHTGWIKELRYYPNKGTVKLTLLESS